METAVFDWDEADSLPLTIRDAFTFRILKISGSEFLLMQEKAEEETTPAGLAKQVDWVAKRTGKQPIYGATQMEAYNRKRLIEHKVPFVVPANQLYLPDLGIDFRVSRKKVKRKPGKLSPSAQLVALAYLLKKPVIQNWTATEMAEVLTTSKMTMSRAIDEFQSHDLATVEQEWREKPVRFNREGKAFWDQVIPFLKSPVRQRVYLEKMTWSMGPLAGLSALSELSMLNSPNREVRALTNKEWKALQRNADLRMIPEASRNLARVELEIWAYDPQKLSQSGIVDPLSLYLSLSHEKDERTESAREALLEDFQW